MSEVGQASIDWARLLEVARALGAERDLDRLLDVILGAAQDLLRADRCSLFLVDHDTGELWTRIAQGSEAIRLARGVGIAGTVAIDGVVINIPDAYADDRFNQENDIRSGYRTRSILAVPLRDHQDRVVGVLQALNRCDAAPFDATDEEVALALCSQAAVAISTAQLMQEALNHQRVQRDLELARTIQQSFLPQQTPEMSRWRIAQWQAPCDETGGDYHDYLMSDGSFDLVVGDVSGHGVGAALMMSTARASIRALHGHGVELNVLLRELNQVLEHDMAQDQFMTMLICRIYDDGKCVYAAAGHEAPLIFRAQGQAFDDLDSTGFPLGIMDDAEFDAVAVSPLQSGDILVSCTDGIFEAADQNGNEWTYERLRETIVAHAHGGAQHVCDAIIDGVSQHLAGAAMQDDASLVVIERLG